MTGRACTENPFSPEAVAKARTLAQADAPKAANWATFTPFIPPNKRPPSVTATDVQSIKAAVSAGRVRRFSPDGKEIA